MINLIPILSFCLNLIILIVSIAGFLKIMKNDLTHLQRGVDELKVTMGLMDKKVDNVRERVAKIEGRLQE